LGETDRASDPMRHIVLKGALRNSRSSVNQRLLLAYLDKHYRGFLSSEKSIAD
jgi:hypothetical protein